jgi:hypothetical protein
MNMDTSSKQKAINQAGTVLIMVIFMSILLAGSATYLLARTRTELIRQRFRKYTQAATQYAISGMTIAQVRVNGGPWDSGPTGEENRVLYSHDSTDNGVPGGYIINDGTYSVRLNNLGDMWYEMTSVGTAGDSLIGDISRVIKLRVRDRDFFSRWALYLENGDAIVDDTNNWYGDVHTNEYYRMRNRIAGLGAHFFGAVTSCNEPQDYAEFGGTAEAVYEQTPIFNADEIHLPATKTFTDLRAQAEEGAGAWTNIWANEADESNLAPQIWVGDNGISIVAKDFFENIQLKFRKDWHHGNIRQEVVVKIIDSDTGALHTETIEVPQSTVIHFQGKVDGVPQHAGIEGIEGEIYGRMTLACATGYIKVSNDIEYEDRHGNHPYRYKDWMPEDPENFVINPTYKGDACLAVMAKKDILLSNHNGDLDLIMHGVFAAGVGDPATDGGVRWFDTSEAGWTNLKRDLRLYGAMIADGVMTSTGMTIGHFKGWTSGGAHAGGYNNSIFKYDHALRANPPPHFMEIQMPLYVGWQLQRGNE